MQTNLEKAKQMLSTGGYTCVICKDDILHTSNERGIKPLLALLDSGANVRGFSAADKVVGKAAASLYVLLGVKEIYAFTMSTSAMAVLKENGIAYEYETETSGIRNRTDTGECPMEEAVKEAGTVEEALQKVRARLASMQIHHRSMRDATRTFVDYM